MAISNFIKGRRYRINSDDLLALSSWQIVSSYLKIHYYDGTVAEFTGFELFRKVQDSTNISLISNVSDNYIILDYFFTIWHAFARAHSYE